MKNGKFTKDEIAYLQALDAVNNVTPIKITYSSKFKSAFMRRYHAGEKPKAIFESVGLRESMIGYKRIERACARWRADEKKYAPNPNSGKASCNSAKRKDQPGKVDKVDAQEIIDSQAAEIKALKAQVAALKKEANL